MAAFSTHGDSSAGIAVDVVLAENRELLARLTEVEETLRAIREGEVDAVVVSGSRGDRIFALSEGENLHRLMVDTMDEAGFATSPEGLVVFCNQRACALLGRPHDQLVGHELGEFVAPAGAEAYTDLLTAAQDAKADARIEFLDASGSEVPMHVWASRLERSDGPLLCLVATDLRRLEVHRDLITLAEASGEFVGIADTEFRPLFLNAAGRRMIGLESEEVSGGAGVLDFFFPEDRAFIQEEFFARVKRDGHAEIETRFRHFKTGEPVWVIYSVVALTDPKGRLTGFGTVTRNITERKKSEEELRESEERFRLAAEAAGFGTYDYYPEEDLSLWSPELYRIAGLPERTALNSSLLEAIVHPEDRETYRGAVTRSLDPSGPCRHEVEYRVNRPDGATVWVRDVGRCYLEKAGSSNRVVRVVGTVQDVSPRKMAVEALRQSEERLRLAAEVAGFGCFELNLETGENSWSDQLRQMFGLEEKDAVLPDLRSSGCLHRDDFGRVERKMRDCVDPEGEGHFEDELRILGADGAERWLYVKAQTYVAGEGEKRRAVRTVGAAIDITQMKAFQSELEQSRAELEERVALRTAQLRQRADQLSRLTSELTLTEQRERRRLAKILHDHLQQILVAARMNLDVSTGDLHPADRKALQRVGALIDDAVRSSRSLTVELSPPILHEAGLSAGLRWLARWMKENHGLDVHLHLQEDADPEREDVRILVFESVRELLFNVVKHAGVWEASISLSRNGGHDIVLIVEDGGKGFDPEVLEKRESHEDQGFGLFSIEERLSLLGGSLSCESAPGAGAKFSLYAPLTGSRLSESAESVLRQTTEDISSEKAEELEAGDDVEAPIRVLLVDDHELVREGLRILISADPGMVVAGEASDGEEGVRNALALKPHVVLMDYSLPLLDGVEATRRIHENLPHIPIIGLSMYDEPDRASAMMEAGAVAYLCKSGQSSAVVDRIREVCRRAAERV